MPLDVRAALALVPQDVGPLDGEERGVLGTMPAAGRPAWPAWRGSASAMNDLTSSGVGQRAGDVERGPADELVVAAERRRRDAEGLPLLEHRGVDRILDGEIDLGRGRRVQRDGGPEHGDLPLVARHDGGLAGQPPRSTRPPCSTAAISVSFDWYCAQRVTSSVVPSV